MVYDLVLYSKKPVLAPHSAASLECNYPRPSNDSNDNYNGNGDNCMRDDPSHTNGGIADADTECVAEREWMRMIDEDACKRIVRALTRSSTGTIARSHILLRRPRDRRGVTHHVNALPDGDCEGCQDCGRENERCAADALVIYDHT